MTEAPGTPEGWSPRVFSTLFLGDHLSYYTSWQNGAFLSARKAVMDLHDRVVATAG